MSFKDKCKNIIYTKFYNQFYSEEDNTELIELLNSNNEDEYTNSVREEIFNMINNKYTQLLQDLESIQRNKKLCYKNKRIKSKTEDGKKYRSKVKKTRFSMKAAADEYSDSIKVLEEEKEYIEQVVENFNKCKLDDDDIQYINELIYENRINPILLRILLVFVIIIIAILILKKIYNF